ncbi:MAG TPA: ATP-binding protein [Phototrophicaceae bacterium]|jgi:PAS domain S-box-containing protein|nr:ATP-binding protein [Phototrophicaceae bacterium]
MIPPTSSNTDHLYRHLLRAAGYASLSMDTEGIITAADNLVAYLTGYSVDELIGKRYVSLFPPETHAMIEANWQRLSNGRESTMETPLHPHNSEPRRVEHILVQVNNGVEGLLHDITAYRQTQEQLRQRVDQLTILSQIEAELAEQLNIDYVLTMAMDATVRLSEAEAGFIGLIEENQFQNFRVIGNYPQATLNAYMKRNMGTIARAVREGQAELILDVNASMDYIAILPDTVSQMIVPLTSRDKVVGILNLETDKPGRFTPQKLELIQLITARVAVAIDNSRLYQQTVNQLDELLGLYERVTKLEQLKTDMIRIASHDLRNPLSVVLSYASMLQHELELNGGSPNAQEYVKNVDIAARQMRKITLDILSLERIEEAAQDASMADCDLRAMIELCFNEFIPQSRLRRHNLQMAVEVPDAWIKGDPIQLTEAINNLIGNAIKYTPDEGQIKVTLERVDKNFVFRVIDNGYGIKENQQARLFQPFFRARSVETRDIEGTGLGLHLVKNIIERHNGKIIFHSVYSEGSTFGFEIPAVTP